jgi:hypothetical protein
MVTLHEAHAYPAPHEAILLFTDRSIRTEVLSVRPIAGDPTLQTESVVRETAVSAELCEPCHFLPRWWKAPEAAE